MRACPHCTEKCVRQLAHICSIGRGSVRAATAGTVAPSHLLLKFGKLTTKFEVLCKETESPQLQNFVGEARDTRGERVVWRAVGRARKSKMATADRDRYGVREWMRGAVRESLAASGRRLSGAHGRRRYTALEIRCFAEKQSLNVLFLSSANRHQSSASFPHFAFPKPSLPLGALHGFYKCLVLDFTIRS